MNFKSQQLRIGSFKILATNEYCKIKGGISTQALRYARENDLVDWVKCGREHLIVMTKKSRDYVPRTSKKRTMQQAA